jgi:alpha-L-fucosidase
MTGKDLTGAMAPWRKALIYDIENGISGGAQDIPWQTDTCIGSWHYKRSRFEQNQYKTAQQVIHMLIDIVSKNGNLMLSIPVRGEGTIDELEVKILEGIASWIAPNGEGIYATRPFKVFGEGPSTTATVARDQLATYKTNDVRFTTKGDTLYAFVMVWPTGGKAVIKTLAKGGAAFPKDIGKVELLGVGAVAFTHDAAGLTITLPDAKPNDYAYCFKITPK